MVKDVIQQGDWMTRIDMKDAYFAIPIHKKHQRYLRFIWQKKVYQFLCLPFGLSSAPRVFTKILRPVIGFLRSNGIRCVIYLDDILIMNQEKDTLMEHTAITVSVLEALGYLINYTKSSLSPQQEITFLGFIIQSVPLELKLPPDKLGTIRKEANQMMKQDLVSARSLAQLIGKMSAALLAVRPAPLHYRSLQALKNRAIKRRSYKAMIRLSVEVREDLTWWLKSLSEWNGRKVCDPSPTMTIETDASKRGWGTACQGIKTGGCWSGQEVSLHINVLEMMAALFAIKAFAKNLQGLSILHLRTTCQLWLM